MKDIKAFSNKTIAKTEDNMNDTENRLKNIAEKEEYSNIVDAIKNNETNTKRLLQQRKFKKDNNLKHKPKSRKDHNKLNIKKRLKKSHTSSAQGTNNANTTPSILHKPNISNTKNESQTLLSKLKILHPAKLL